MSRVRFARQAEADLEEIWLDVARHQGEAADRVVGGILIRCRMLSAHPDTGQRRDRIARSLRSFSVDNYAIFYRRIENGVDIVRVLPGARDLETLF